MAEVFCPVCRRSNSEFDARCAACGSELPLVSTEASRLPTMADGPRAEEFDDETDPLIGREVSHFRIVAPVGRGGMGVVYRAVDLDLGRVVALKFLGRSSDRTARDEERFRREARAAAALDHPNVGTVYEVGEHEGRRFLAMAFYDGDTLSDRLAQAPERRLDVRQAASIAGQLAAALAAAHGAGIVHRDLKPENVMLLHDGLLKLLDFGLAHSAGAAPLTELGLAVGTAAYMPPESFAGERGEEIGPAGDLWAFGVLLYEALAGERPFGGERRGMVHAILHEEPTPLEEIRPDLPPALIGIVRRCLGKTPTERPTGAREILADLAAARIWEETGSGGVAKAPSEGSGSKGAQLSVPSLPIGMTEGGNRRPTALFVAIAASLLALLAVGIVVFLRTRPPAPPVYVAVLEPKVTGPEPESEHALIAANLQAAILRALAALDGIAAVESAQVRAVSGGTSEIARAVAAGEVISAEAACAADLCQVRLRRLSGTDGRVLWTAALQLPPSRPLVFAEAITASIQRGYPDRDARFRSAGLAIDEEAYRRYLHLRQEVTGGQNLDLALGRLEALRGEAPKMIEVYSLEASIARRRFGETGDRRYLDRGLEIARRARRLAPDDPRPLASLFDLELQAGHLDRAEELLDSFENLDPAAALLRRGQLAERRGQDDPAIEMITAAVRMQPSWRTLLILANAEYRLGRLDAARGHLAELLERSPGNVEGMRTLAQIELLNDPKRAAALLEQLAAKKPDAGSLSNLGLAYLLLRRYAEAETSFRRTLALTPHDPAAALNLADCLILRGRESEARSFYRDLVSAGEPERTLDKWPLWSIRAQAWAHLGEPDRAIETLDKALRLTPDNAQLAFEAAVVYIVIGDRRSALFHARRAAAAGLDPRWFAFSWFDPLRADPAFPSAKSGANSAPPDPATPRSSDRG